MLSVLECFSVVIHCIRCLLLRVLCWSYFNYSVLNSVHSSFAIILKREKMLFGLLLLSSLCLVTISALCIFLTVPSVGLIVVFPDRTRLRF